MNTETIIARFQQFFIDHAHTLVSGASIVPAGDNTLLFTNAGMNQFKDIFLGTALPSHDPVTTNQLCIRAGGKHNDLSQVGFTERHLTSFFMLGNFSFGAYFKEEAIAYAWKFLTEAIGIEKERLWVTVFKDDHVAEALWEKIGVPKSRITRLGEKDNFWQMGEVGPCGPCSEIYFDRGIRSEIDKEALPGDDHSTRFIEIWNLVFMQYQKQSNGTTEELKKKGIDTGMGLERLAMVLQGKENVFATDAFIPLINALQKEVPPATLQKMPHAVNAIIDHIRTAAFIIDTGIIPSNEGRGYVVRKIIRRAAVFYSLLSEHGRLSTVMNHYLALPGTLYQSLLQNHAFIQKVFHEECEKFEDNLTQGNRKFLEFTHMMKKNSSIPGSLLFTLYDTYGFPLEIVEVLAREKELSLDYEGYEACMEKQRIGSKKQEKFSSYGFEGVVTPFQQVFTGYQSYNTMGTITTIVKEGAVVNTLNAGERGVIFCHQTPFYARSGGQEPDHGTIVHNTIAHDIHGIVKSGKMVGFEMTTTAPLTIGDSVEQQVTYDTRWNTALHHTATHILHAVLRNKYGTSIRQAGSFVSAEKLTFDFTHNASLSKEELNDIEESINDIIRKNIPVTDSFHSYTQAIAAGAIAFFEDKYDKEKVRMITIGTSHNEIFSRELCGGTHAPTTGALCCAIIEGCTSIASGIKRITAYVGNSALKKYEGYKQTVRRISNHLSINEGDIFAAIEKKEERIATLQEQLQQVQQEMLHDHLALFLRNSIKRINDLNCGVFFLPHLSEHAVKESEEYIQQKVPGVYLILEKKEGFSQIVLSCTALEEKKKEALCSSLITSLTKHNNFKGKIQKNGVRGVLFLRGEHTASYFLTLISEALLQV